MNRLVKGSVWGAAGVALLLGGTGTFALWSDGAELGSTEQVQAGHLYIDEVGEGVWYDVTGVDIPTFEDAAALDAFLAEHGTPVADVDAHGIVPGDTLWYVGSVDVVAQGANLKATLGIDVPEGTFRDGTDTSPFAESGDALADGVTISFVGPGSSDDSFEVTAAGLEPQTFDYALQLAFDDAAADNDAQGAVVDLTGIRVSLDQHL